MNELDLSTTVQKIITKVNFGEEDVIGITLPEGVTEIDIECVETAAKALKYNTHTLPAASEIYTDSTEGIGSDMLSRHFPTRIEDKTLYLLPFDSPKMTNNQYHHFAQSTVPNLNERRSYDDLIAAKSAVVPIFRDKDYKDYATNRTHNPNTSRYRILESCHAD